MLPFQDIDALYDTVCDIFAVTVLIDQRERDNELIEYVHAAMVQNQILRPDIILTRRQILARYEARKPFIKAALLADDDDAYKAELLINIHDKDLQKRVLSSIFTISICDYEMHDEESNFIKTALKIWKSTLPNQADVDMVC